MSSAEPAQEELDPQSNSPALVEEANPDANEEDASMAAVAPADLVPIEPSSSFLSTAILCTMCRFLKNFCGIERMPGFTAPQLEEAFDASSRTRKPHPLLEEILVAFMSMFRSNNRKIPKINKRTYQAPFRRFLLDHPDEFFFEYSSIWHLPAHEKVEMFCKLLWRAMEDSPEVHAAIDARTFNVEILRPEPSFKYRGFSYYIFSQREHDDACRMYRENNKTRKWEVVCTTWSEMRQFGQSLSARDKNCQQMREFCLEEAEFQEKEEHVRAAREAKKQKEIEWARQSAAMHGASGRERVLKGKDLEESADEEENANNGQADKQSNGAVLLPLVEGEGTEISSDGKRRSFRLKQVARAEEEAASTVATGSRRSGRSIASRYIAAEDEIDELIDRAIRETEGDEGFERSKEIVTQRGRRAKLRQLSDNEEDDEEEDDEEEDEEDEEANGDEGKSEGNAESKGGSPSKRRKTHSDGEAASSGRKRRRKRDDDDDESFEGSEDEASDDSEFGKRPRGRPLKSEADILWEEQHPGTVRPRRGRPRKGEVRAPSFKMSAASDRTRGTRPEAQGYVPPTNQAAMAMAAMQMKIQQEQQMRMMYLLQQQQQLTPGASPFVQLPNGMIVPAGTVPAGVPYMPLTLPPFPHMMPGFQAPAHAGASSSSNVASSAVSSAPAMPGVAPDATGSMQSSQPPLMAANPVQMMQMQMMQMAQMFQQQQKMMMEQQQRQQQQPPQPTNQASSSHDENATGALPSVVAAVVRQPAIPQEPPQ